MDQNSEKGNSRRALILQKTNNKKVQEQYRRELALKFYKKAGNVPPVRTEKLQYSGGGKGYLIIPDTLVYSGKHLSAAEKMIWIAIFLHNWNPDPTYRVSWPGRERLSIITGKSVRQVTNSLNSLRCKGLLKTLRRLDKSSLFLLNDPSKAWARETKRKLNSLKMRKKRAQKERFGEES